MFSRRLNFSTLSLSFSIYPAYLTKISACSIASVSGLCLLKNKARDLASLICSNFIFGLDKIFDNRVLYSEPIKYIAKLRDTKSDNNVQLLKCKLKAAGHGGMSGRDNSIIELAEEYSFLLKTAEIKN